ncbi:hypothetical protein KIN20_022782 [Parelaphostrongylus tenuis]|uniref:Protein kinase domain-containing protein n=1 Tax=Parelaphostrongylus tenuis TaxID=148309 RepID=A0AAD5MR12_PARTN|nr:hypothetical protein KIN20_022782 [Parelaphostrongylus tenuis]
MTVEFMTGILIWYNDEDKLIERKKEKIGSRLLLECPQEVFTVHDHIRFLKYDSKPHYTHLQCQLNQTIFSCVKTPSRNILHPGCTEDTAQSAAMSTSSSIPKCDIKRGSMIYDWKVIRKIGSGGFGTVYEVEKGGIRGALKAEIVDQTGKRRETLTNEVKQLRVLQWSDHFCRLYLACRLHYGKETVSIMIMNLMERSLSLLRRMTPERRFTRSTAVRLSRQCLEAIHDLHRTGLLHRDIKANNFVWSTKRIVCLLDLGFCRRFICARVSCSEYQPYDWEDGGYYHHYYVKKSDTEKELSD